MSDLAFPFRSPDGQWWWDGTAWQPIATLPVLASAPAAAPAEPDWPAWLPRSSAAEAVVAGVERRADRSGAPGGTASTGLVEIPGEARSSTWAQAQYRTNDAPGANRPRLPILAGIVVLVLVAVFVTFKVLSQPGLFSIPSAPDTVVASTPDSAGSQYEQADGFMTRSYNPALRQATVTMGPLSANCTGADTPTCRDSIAASDNAIKNLIAVIDRGPVPACIAKPVTKVRTDFSNMEHGLAEALLGYQLNQHRLVAEGLIAFAYATEPLAADGNALSRTVSSGACPK